MALRDGNTHTATITSPSRTQTLRFPDRTLARLWCERDYRARSHDTNAPVWEPRKGKRGNVAIVWDTMLNPVRVCADKT